MGLTGSKIGKQATKEEPVEGNIPSTPILTPTAIRKNEFDPRSPSANISRTPLEILTAAAEKLEGLPNTDIETSIPDAHYVLDDDPRSPSNEFKRTPIIVNAKEDLLKRLHTKNIERKLKSDPTTPVRNSEVKANIVPPKLLDSSPIKPKSDTNKRKSFVGLLETNIDYTETDIDAVFQEKCKLAGDTPKKITVVETTDIDPRSPTNDFVRTPIQVIRKVGEIDLNRDGIFDDNEEDIFESEVVVEELITEIVNAVVDGHYSAPDEVLLEHDNDDNNDQCLKTEDKLEVCPVTVPNIIAVDEMLVTVNKEVIKQQIVNGTAPVTPPCNRVTPVETLPNKESKSAPITPRPLNVDIQQLDKKLTDLIYEDTDLVVCPRVVTLKDCGIRSPLRTWNGDGENIRSAQKLKVRDKPRKTEHVVSKIPVFKEKARKSVVQCENTPPRNVEKKNKSKPQPCLWDPNTTLYL